MGITRDNSYFLKLILCLGAISTGALNAFEDGIKIPSYQEALKKVYVDATRFEEVKIDPSKSGGSTLMGLIGRLMGGSPNSQFEGMGVQRYVYPAFKGDTLIGVSHGSTIDVDGKLINVFVHYNADANLKEVEVTEAPETVLALLKSGNYLSQFRGYSTEDFQTTYEKKRRKLITHSGRALRLMKWPQESVAKNYFDKILRSLKYNVAFVDIAYFISRLPMMDTQSRRISSVARGAGSPETMAAGTQLSSPTGDSRRSFVINAPTP